ncbi:chaperonin 10-like protein [Diplogelasinospora grovesii]|uniref:Chaperonin 10-like protein n=1 Tax=Diplogelasinospora grovesii TaxID=303347 RepID=A0AAN6MZY9_9PEZI|nr:chaperonin 10-like protein [Diplogelasinospora grovesii]
MSSATLLPAGIPATHPAVATVAVRAPLEIAFPPTEAPGPGEVLVHVLWTASSPLDLHQADGGLLVKHPFAMGTSFAGRVAVLGPDSSQRLKVGDEVFGFTFRSPREKGFQTYITTDQYMTSRLPKNLTLQEAVAVPTNLVTAFHTITADLELPLPWPVPSSSWQPELSQTPILVWGAASSVGLYTLQVLRHWGYRSVIAVASSKHHEMLKGVEYGAAACFDYSHPQVASQIIEHVTTTKTSDNGCLIPFMIDCIGSREGSLRPLTKLAEKGTKVAVMLPVINIHASHDREPEYEMDVSRVLMGEWKEGVQLRGTRTHFYLRNEFFKDHLQPEIVPALLEQGVIKPNKARVVEGKTLLERAQNALDLLRIGAPSGEKLVWRVAEDDDERI